MDRDEPSLLTIGEFAAVCGVSATTLRHYHDIGLVEPASVDPTTGYRRYRVEQARAVAAIVGLRRVDMPLPEIARLVTRPDRRRTHEILAAHRQRLAGQRSDVERRLYLIERLITLEVDDVYDITEIDVPPVRVVTERIEGPSNLSAAMQAAALAGMAARLAQRGIQPTAQPIIVVHHGDEEHSDEEACLPVARDTDLGEGFLVRELEPVHAATATHVGPLDEIVLMVHAVMGWIAGHGRELDMPFRLQLLSLPPLFTVAGVGGGDQPVTQVFVPFHETT